MSNMTDIWKLMDEYKFKVDPDSIHDDMSCSICKNLMRDACHSICGCQYCYKCITEYIGDSDKYCPGDKIKCKEEYLNIDEDVIKDARMNKRILKSRVLCPNESCDSKIKLSQMKDHLKKCITQFMECPFSTVGCDKEHEEKEEMLIHLHNDSLSHTELLMECIHSLRNEVSGIKSSLDMRNLEIDFLKDESRLKDIQIREMREENDRQKRELEARIIAAMDQTISLKMEMIEERKENVTQKRILEEEMKEFMSKMSMEKTVVVDRRRKTHFCNMSEDMKAKVIHLRPIIDTDIFWKIDEISRKNWKRIYSESFYSFNYKFCLSIFINYFDIWVYCLILKGDNDDRVEWPMRLPVTMSFINQETMKAYMTERIQYDTYKHGMGDFDRTYRDMEKHGIGTNDLIRRSSNFANDSIVVSCVIGDI